MWPTPLVPVLLAVALATGCGLLVPQPTFERASRGPSADEIFVMRSYLAYGREPNFDERRRWQDEVDDRVGRYLREHPGLEQSPRYSDIRFWRQVSEGSPVEEVLVLLDRPDETTRDAGRMAQLADRFWPSLSEKAREAWLYPGWVLFFDDKVGVGFIKVLNLPSSSSLPARQ